MAGLFKLSWEDCADGTGLNRKEIGTAIKEAEQRGFIKYDADTRLLWIINRIKWEFPHGKISYSQRIKIKSYFRYIPKCALVFELVQKYQDLGEPFDTLCHTLSHSPSDSPSHTPQEKEGTLGIGKGIGEGAGKEASGVPGDPTTPARASFEAFWSLWPHGRRVNKKAARAQWDTAVHKYHHTEIMVGLEKQKQAADWARENGKFIPHPHRWLRDERWKDEVDSPKSQVESAEATEERANKRREDVVDDAGKEKIAKLAKSVADKLRAR